MKTISFKASAIYIKRFPGNADHIILHTTLSNNMPHLSTEPCILSLSTTEGYAEQWLKDNLGLTSDDYECV